MLRDIEATQVAGLRIDAPSLSVGVEPAARGATWLCLVTVRMIPTGYTIRHAGAELRTIAESCGGRLDGWDAAVPW